MGFWNGHGGGRGASVLRTGYALFPESPDGKDNLSYFQMTHIVRHEFDDMTVGMGWLRRKLPESENEVIFHDGVSGGYASYMAMTADYRYGVVVLSNTAKPVVPIGQALLKALIRPASATEDTE